MTTLYIEPIGGLSGNMMLAALLDLGLDAGKLEGLLKENIRDNFKMVTKVVEKHGMKAKHLDFEIEESHHHRHFSDIKDMILQTKLSDKVKQDALGMFEIVARAEGKVHGLPYTDVHFHEVGALDSILDLVGTAILMEMISADEVVFKALPRGNGLVKCAHGLMPVPAPATQAIYEAHGLETYPTEIQGEMVTPTGAAIAAFYHSKGKSPTGKILRGGLGAGTKDFSIPNVVRASLYEDAKTEGLWVLETNLDDMTGEDLSYAQEVILKAGALDVWLTPILMKKGRPGYTLSLLTEESLKATLIELLFKHTTTLGVRFYEVKREILERSFEEVQTELGHFRKKCVSRDGRRDCKTEFEDIKVAAEEHQISLREVRKQI